jgi:hypothetical protein
MALMRKTNLSWKEPEITEEMQDRLTSFRGEKRKSKSSFCGCKGKGKVGEASYIFGADPQNTKQAFTEPKLQAEMDPQNTK